MEVCEVKLELGRVIQRLVSEITGSVVTRFSNNQFINKIYAVYLTRLDCESIFIYFTGSVRAKGSTR